MEHTNILGVLFVVVFLSLFVVGGVRGVECDSSLSQLSIYNNCSVSSNLTLNASMIILANGNNASGVININSNVVLDGNGTTLQGNFSDDGVHGLIGYKGIYISGKSNITIRNLTIVNYEHGIWIENSNVTIQNNNISNNYRGITLRLLGLLAGGIINYNQFNNNNYSGIWSYGTSIGAKIEYNDFVGYSNAIRSETYNTNRVSIGFNNFYQTDTRYSAIDQGAQSGDWQVYNNNIYSSGVSYSYGMLIRGQNNTFYNNYIDNTQYNFDVRGNNNTFINNTITNGDEGSICINGDLINFINNTFINMTQNIDTYNVGLKLYNCSNVLVYGNNFSELATVGVLSQNSNNISIINNIFNFIPLSERSKYLANDGYEPRCAIQSTMYYKGFYPTFGNYNLTIRGNSFDENTPCYLQLENQTLLNHDLDNYWYRSFDYINNVNGKREFYIPDYYNNLSRSNSVGTYYDLRLGGSTTGSGCSLGTCKYLEYSEYKTYSYYKNINLTSSFQLNKYSLSSALIYNTSYYPTQGSGNINITLQPNEYIYVLDNFNLTEGQSRQYSPIWFSSSSNTEKHIVSNLSEGITTTVVLNVPCRTAGDITYRSDTGLQTWTLSRNQYTCVDNQVTFENVLIEPALNSNIFTIYLPQIEPGICGTILNLNNLGPNWLGLIFTAVFFSIILVLIITMAIPYITGNNSATVGSSEYFGPLIAIFAVLLIVTILVTVTGLFVTGMCGV